MLVVAIMPTITVLLQAVFMAVSGPAWLWGIAGVIASAVLVNAVFQCIALARAELLTCWTATPREQIIAVRCMMCVAPLANLVLIACALVLADRRRRTQSISVAIGISSFVAGACAFVMAVMLDRHYSLPTTQVVDSLPTTQVVDSALDYILRSKDRA